MVKDLTVIYNKVYALAQDPTEEVPTEYLINILQKLAFTHINSHIFFDFIEDILPENTWRHGYTTNQLKYDSVHGVFDNNEKVPDYDVKIAIISKLLSILRLTSVKEIPFELGAADLSILPLKKSI